MAAYGLLLFLVMGTQPVEVPDVDVLALNQEMKDFLDEHVKSVHDPTQRLHTLVNTVFDEDFLNLTYDNSRTKTAIETFQSRSGNCLSFTNMFVAMARYVGLYTRFQEVINLPSWNKHGNVVVLNLHINAVSTVKNRKFSMDFNPYGDRRENKRVVITDKRAKAQYYNNLGAEFFSKGENEKALAWFKHAVTIDPKLSYGWSNMGVALSHMGNQQEAEDAYKKAIELNDSEYTAIGNLAALYEYQNRDEEARPLLDKVEHFRRKNPYYHFGLGEAALNRREYREAVRHFRQAVRRKTQEHEFHFALARAYKELGELDRASASLEKAREYAPDVFNRDRYSQKLERMAAGPPASEN